MENKDKVIELLKKLKALADRGIGGEKINAENMLNSLMLKHNITLEEIGGEERKKFDFTIKLDHKDLFFQIVRSVVLDYNGQYYRVGNSRPKIRMELTHSEYIELEAKYSVYSVDFDKQFDELKTTYFRAFCRTNKLYGKYTPKDEDKEIELSEEDMIQARKTLHLEQMINKTQYHKQLKE